jgi:hypothetical protein
MLHLYPRRLPMQIALKKPTRHNASAAVELYGSETSTPIHMHMLAFNEAGAQFTEGASLQSALSYISERINQVANLVTQNDGKPLNEIQSELLSVTGNVFGQMAARLDYSTLTDSYSSARLSADETTGPGTSIRNAFTAMSPLATAWDNVWTTAEISVGSELGMSKDEIQAFDHQLDLMTADEAIREGYNI